MIKFPSIDQFRSVIRNVNHKASFQGLDAAGEPIYASLASKPTLTFEGTVKLHGTNAAIVYHPDGEISFQSRERVLSAEADNAGFYAHMSQNPQALQDLLTSVGENYQYDSDKPLAVFGEWCGGNIQKNVGLSGLPKMFVIFGISAGGVFLHPGFDFDGLDPDLASAGIHTINAFSTWKVDIDFNSPQDIQNKLVELTLAVEEECPVAKAFGQSGVGEGIVWKCVTPGWESSDYWFKVKGEKHSASKVKTLAAVDVEQVKAVKEFVEMACTENRMAQGLEILARNAGEPLSMKRLGDFIRWVNADIMKEEMDTIVANGLDPKKLGHPIATKCRKWFSENYDQALADVSLSKEGQQRLAEILNDPPAEPTPAMINLMSSKES